MRTEYHVHVISNPNPSEEVLNKVREVAQELSIPVDELMAPELNFHLDEMGYRIWFTTMIAHDPSFSLAPHFWSRGDSYMSRTGDEYLVQTVRIL